MTLQELKAKAIEIADRRAAEFEHVNQVVYDFAELGMEEHKTVAFLTEELRKLGFTVTHPYCGLETGFRAEIGSGHPKVAFLAEYDALPGYGPNADQNGHACGHNWIGANCFGACAVLAELSEHFEGTIVYMGCPAEEAYGGKVDLVNGGAFDDIDAAMQIHISGGDESLLGATTLAIDSVEFTFEGVAAHAAGFPEKGVNALDACYLTFNGINALRQHVTPDVRIHGVINEGGTVPNIVPSHCVAKFFVRAADREYLTGLTQKVINCAKGAELMTGAKLSWRYFENSFDNVKLCPALQNLMRDNLVMAGEEEKFLNMATQPPGGSSDVGNVSQVCPTVMVNMGIHNQDGSNCHEEAFLPYCTGEYGFKGLNKAVKAQALTALDIFCNPDILKEM